MIQGAYTNVSSSTAKNVSASSQLGHLLQPMIKMEIVNPSLPFLSPSGCHWPVAGYFVLFVHPPGWPRRPFDRPALALYARCSR